MIGAEIAIDSNVELVLGIRFHRRAREIVCGSWACRQRVMLQDPLRDRIKSVRRYGSQSLAAHRIGDWRRENPLALGKRRHRADASDRGAQAAPLPVGKEEGFAFLNRSTQGETILIAPEFRSWPRRREKVPGVQILIAEELEQRAVQRVAA